MCAPKMSRELLNFSSDAGRLFLPLRTRQLGFVATALCSELRGCARNPGQSFTLLLFPCLRKEGCDATFSNLLALNEVYKKKLCAWRLAHSRHLISVSWIRIYTKISASCRAGGLLSGQLSAA